MAFLGKSQEEVDAEVKEAVRAAEYRKQQEITTLKRIVAAYEKKEADSKKINITEERTKMVEAELTSKIAEQKKSIESLTSRLDEAQDENDELKERARLSEHKASELKNTLARYLSRENGEQAKERYYTQFNLHYRVQKKGDATIYDIHLPVPASRENLASALSLANEFQEKREESGEFKLRRIDLWAANGEYIARYVEKTNPDFDDGEPF